MNGGKTMNSDAKKNDVAKTGADSLAMVRVNLAKAEKVKRHKLSFKEHKLFVILFSVLGVLAVGLAVAIVVVGVVKNQEPGELAEWVDEREVELAVRECSENENVGEVLDCLQGVIANYQSEITRIMNEKINKIAESGEYDENNLDTGDYSYIDEDEEVEAKLVELIYGPVIDKYVAEGKDIDAAYAMAEQVFSWVSDSQCCRAKQLFESDNVKNMSASAKVVFYSRAIGVLGTCGYEDQMADWENVLLEAKVKASEEYAAQHN